MCVDEALYRRGSRLDKSQSWPPTDRQDIRQPTCVLLVVVPFPISVFSFFHFFLDYERGACVSAPPLPSPLLPPPGEQDRDSSGGPLSIIQQRQGQRQKKPDHDDTSAPLYFSYVGQFAILFVFCFKFSLKCIV